MKTSRTWFVRLAIAGVLVVGAALVWWRWGQDPSQAPRATAAQGAVSAAKQASLKQSAGPALVGARPQEEAAAVKQEAVTVAGEVAEAYPKDAFAYALLGAACYNTGRSDEAIKHLQRCLELSPDLAEAYEILARVSYDKGDIEETARLCQEALKRSSATPEVLNRLGRALMDLGRAEDAVRTLQQAVGLPNVTSESCYLLGQANLQSGRHELAKESFQRAVALVPDHTQAFFGLYTACVRLGQTEEAERYREQFVKFEALDRQTLTDRSAREDTLTGLPLVRKTAARTVFGAAQIYRAHEQTEKAAALVRRSAALDAENPMYRAALESIYVQRNAPADGVRVFEQLAAEQPENGLNHLFLGRLHSRLEQFEAAERSFRKVQQLAPQWAEGYRALAELYLRANRKADVALSLARRALELEPSGAHNYLLAVACLKNNDRVGAFEAVNQALAMNPNEISYQQFLQQLQQTP